MKRAVLLLLCGLVSGCGLTPMYAGGGDGTVAQSLRHVEIGPVPGRAGWLIRNALIDRLGAGGDPAYRLQIALDDDVTGFGVRRDNAVTRERRTLRARYQLVEARSGAVVLDATAGADAGIDVVSSEYATVAAEQTALERLSQDLADQIVRRVALFVRASDQPRKQ